jgi:hypothetical protein
LARPAAASRVRICPMSAARGRLALLVREQRRVRAHRRRLNGIVRVRAHPRETIGRDFARKRTGEILPESVAVLHPLRSDDRIRYAVIRRFE